MRGDKTQKVSARSPSVRMGWRFLPKVDGNIFFLRKNSEGFLWDSLVLVWNVSLAADLGWWTGKGWEQGRAFLKMKGLFQCEQTPWSTDWSVSVHGLTLLCMVKSRESHVLGHSTCSSVCAKQWSEVVLKHFLVSDYRQLTVKNSRRSWYTRSLGCFS